MREKKIKKKHPVRNVFLVLLAAAVIAGGVFSYFGGFGTGPSSDVTEFAQYAKAISEITIPEGTRIVALGEATHGNVEFQQLKLEVFKEMVEKYGVRAFIIEGDYGGSEVVNRFITRGEGTAKEAAAAIGFAIYRTAEMEQLIQWMRDYNEQAGQCNGICFYGCDMQRIAYNYQFLLESAQDFEIDTTDLEAIWEEDHYVENVTLEKRVDVITALREELATYDEHLNAEGIHCADVLLQNIELGQVINSSNGNAVRDKMMAKNVMWILEQEEKRGNTCVFLSGHNGHVAQFGSYGGENNEVLGNLLANELENAYFAIGTDYYKTNCNLPKGYDGKRANHSFYSYDPLAKAAAKCGYEKCWLDFSTLSDESSIRSDVEAYQWMGSLGEAYSPIMRVLPITYRVYRSPARMYDGMILVTKAHPTQIVE